ncbi:peptidase [Mycolicibacterium sediminis]|uniref:Peptidase n=1 Tax=Mycolicibacterium sediminis TaxID=1286180 RepID=A0A7I7QW30_9MYCO|nr:peptidase [Mycolicibacterium sediminis]BBY30558.1 peptidase [Mycolicibacterium sediminis]
MGVALLGRPGSSPAPPPVPVPAAATTGHQLHDGRTAEVIPMGGPATIALADRIRRELDGAVDAVTAFWGDSWPRHLVITVTGSPDQFVTLSGGQDLGPDIAAVTTANCVVFAPGAAGLSDATLRIVLRHELLHFAARAQTAPDAPRWLTEGVADYVGRPPAPRPGPEGAAAMARVPTDADLETVGATRSAAYDRAWWFARFVADRWGVDALRRLYLAACGPGHVGIDEAVRTVLGSDLGAVLVEWRQWLGG